MLHKLFSYYWNILKNGRQKVCSPINPAPYGREELETNQHWYGFTALALVCGLAIGVCGIWYWGIKSEHCSYPNAYAHTLCLCEPSPYSVPDFPSPYPNGKLALGTKVKLEPLEFRIPKPSPRIKLPPPEGIKKDKEILDPLSDERRFCTDCEFILPEIPEPEEKVIYPNEPGCSCFSPVDEKPRVVNLAAITKLITYPGLLQSEGGTVVLRVLIDKNGRYKRHKILKTDNSLLLQAIEDHIDELKFTPAILAGRPKQFWVNVPFVFKALGESLDTPAPSKTIADQAEHLPPTSAQLLEFFSEEIPLNNDPFIHEPIEDIELRIDEFRILDQEPIPLNMNEVIKLFYYPKLALEAEISGRVILRVLVNKKGRISKHQIINKVHPLLAQEFEKHIYALKFKPAIHKDKRVDAWVNIPFSIKPLD